MSRVAMHAARRAGGFTLLELLVVLTIVAVAAGLMTMALRDGSENILEEEAARLATLLEGARSQARLADAEVQWRPTATEAQGDTPGATGFEFVGLPAALNLPRKWLHDGVSAQVVGAATLRLGPEPVIGAQRVVLSLGDRRIMLATDGLAPFDTAPSGDVAALP